MGRHLEMSPAERARRIRSAWAALKQGCEIQALRARGFSDAEIAAAKAKFEAEPRGRSESVN